MTLSHEKDHFQFSPCISLANKLVCCILPLLPFVSVNLMVIKEAFFTFPVDYAVSFNLWQIAIVPLKFDRFKFP